MARDMFRERVAAGREIALHELIYPVLQGYDSFAMRQRPDHRGTDQLFNEQLGRHFQQRLGSPPQALITSTITPGIDGGPKQSKSLNNYVALTDTPQDKFGKLMSLPDPLIETYAHVYTELPLDVVAALGERAAHGGPAARDAKLKLAAAVVTRYHGANVAKAERAAFTEQFSRRNIPDDLPEVTVQTASPTVLELLQAARPELSNSELRRLIRQGAVSIDDQKVLSHDQEVVVTEPATLRSGSRTFHRIIRGGRCE